MARVAGPDKHRGWTCVNCNAAGDPEEDHLEDPADSRPCGCEEAEALKAERDTFRDMARARGDLLVTEVERRLAAERQLTIIRGIDTASAESRLAEATALLARIEATLDKYEADSRCCFGDDIARAEADGFRNIRDLLRAHKAGGS
jgi:hypothetical protein